jgi:DMSO reductase anchor subunit
VPSGTEPFVRIGALGVRAVKRTALGKHTVRPLETAAAAGGCVRMCVMCVCYTRATTCYTRYSLYTCSLLRSLNKTGTVFTLVVLLRDCGVITV